MYQIELSMAWRRRRPKLIIPILLAMSDLVTILNVAHRSVDIPD